MEETRLNCFEHVERRPVDSIGRRVNQMEGSQIPGCKNYKGNH